MEDKTPKDFEISIDKSLIAAMPAVTFPGRIFMADTEEKVREAVDTLSRESIVGFDTETRPSFHKGKVNTVALMQVSTRDTCFLFRINMTGITDRLKAFLEDPAIVKVGLSLRDDFSVMHRSNDFSPASFIDLQTYVKQFGIADLALQRIYAILFGERISKHQRLTNWEADELTQAQQIYAAIDAWACLKIYDYLSAGSFIPEESRYRRPKETPLYADESKTL